MNDMASVLNSVGLHELALDFAVEALSLADQLRLDGRVRCELNTTVGMIHLDLGDLRTASRHLKIADELVRGEPYYDKVKSVTLGNLGELELARGNLIGAERLFKEQMSSARRGSFARQIAGAYLNLGTLDQSRNQLTSALKQLRSAFNQSAKFELMSIATQSVVRMAQICERLGEIDQALRWHEILDSISCSKRKAGWYWGDWSVDRWRARGIKDHATLLARRGRPLEAWRVGETLARERSWPLVASMLGNGHNSTLSETALEAQGILDYGHSVARQGPNKIAAPTDLQVLIARSGMVATELSRRAKLAESCILSRFFRRDLTNTEFLGAVREILTDDGVLLQYVVCETHTLAVCVSRDTISTTEIQLGEAELQECMTKMSPVFSSSGQGSSIWNAAMADFDLAANIRLRDSIWTPVRHVTANVRMVYVVPDGPLAALPLEVLVGDLGAVPSARSFGNLDFLVKYHAFS